MQLVSSTAQTDAVVCSTLMEAWQIAKSVLMAEGIVKDVRFRIHAYNVNLAEERFRFCMAFRLVSIG